MNQILEKKQLSETVYQMRVKAPLIARERKAAVAMNEMLANDGPAQKTRSSLRKLRG